MLAAFDGGADYMTRRIAAFACAVLATYVAASIASTQTILHGVSSFGLPVSLGVRADATVHDLLGLAATYLPILAITLLVAFPATALVLRFAPIPRLLAYALAGAAALFALHALMAAVLGMHPLPATRSATGMALQAAAGAIGGLTFARVAPGPRPAAKTAD